MAKETKKNKKVVVVEKCPITPLRDKVVLQEIKHEGETKTASGIIIPDKSDQDRDTKRGLVVAVGPGKFIDGKREPVNLKVGQTVIYTWGDDIKFADKKYVIVGEENITAILED